MLLNLIFTCAGVPGVSFARALSDDGLLSLPSRSEGAVVEAGQSQQCVALASDDEQK